MRDTAAPREWSADRACAGFEATTLPLPAEDDGELCATLVRRTRNSTDAPRRAVLYVHGFIDYFFQIHVADAFAANGWDFYALDLRRYGRSLRGGNRPNYITDLAEYDAEITMAIEIVRNEEAHDTLVLLGHSTGGLITSLYMHRGARRADVQALVLNSPFFAFNIPASRRWTLSVASAVGAVFPKLFDPKPIPRWYGESLLADYHGEWIYHQEWKPLLGFPVYFGWARAIRSGHETIARGLSVACPVLLLHAHASQWASGGWKDAYLTCDTVLNVEHMKARGPRLGAKVTLHEVNDGMHDLFLSRADVRVSALEETMRWLAANTPTGTTRA